MKISSFEKNKIHYFNSNDKNIAYDIGQTLYKLLAKYTELSKIIIFLCIGTDRATGDSLGPIIGYKLSKFKQYNYYVYGTLKNPVHAKNLEDTIKEINRVHKNNVIVAIDASLGRSSHIGYITVGEIPLKPGAGVAKDLPEVGHISITGIVNFSGILDHMLLQTTRLNTVMDLADEIYLAINYCIYKLKSNNYIYETKKELINI